MRRFHTLTALLVAAVLSASLVTGQEAEETALDDLCTRVQRQFDLVSEVEVIQALKLGRDLGRPYTVAIAIKTYMSRQRRPSLSLLELAIDNALLVGDLRTAVARCKTYLSIATPDERASDIAARMYGAQIDFLGAADDAFRFMKENGGRFRDGVSARKFDLWFLGQAKSRRDYEAYAERLEQIFADQIPLEQERLYYWESMDWLMGEIRTPSETEYGAASYCRKVAARIRGDERRKLRYSLYAANLAFRAAAKGKDKLALDREFNVVLGEAKAYIDKYPEAGAMRDILVIFHEAGWDNQTRAKRAFFADSFGKLSSLDRESIMKWRHGSDAMAGLIATREQWAALGSQNAALFRRSPATAHVPFAVSGQDAASYKKQAEFLGGVMSRDAAVINSLAAGDSLDAAVDHLVTRESWWMRSASDVYAALSQGIWPAYKGMKDASDDDYRKAVARFGLEHVSKTPIAVFDPKTCEGYILNAWRMVRADARKGQMASYLKSLDWVPFSQRDREYVFGSAYQEFKRWADDVRKGTSPAAKQKQELASKLSKARADLATSQKAKAALRPDDSGNIARVDAKITKLNREMSDLQSQVAAAARGAAGMDSDLAALSPLSAAFKRAMNPAISRSSAAPNDLCKHLVAAVTAVQSKNTAAYVAAARQCYALLQDAANKKTPLARATTVYLISQGSRMDIVDFQAEVLADQFAGWKEGGDNSRIEEVANTIMRSRRNWDWYRVPRGEEGKVKKINAVLAKAFGDVLDKGDFSPQLFNLLKGTRRGNGWHDSGMNSDLLVRLIKEKRLPVVDLMTHANYEFRLSKEYSVESYFDDMFVEEATANNRLDVRYWDQRGKDLKRKVRNAAAKIIQGYGAIPFGYGDAQAGYSPADFWRWQTYALDAEPTIRDTMLDKIMASYGKDRFDSYARGRSDFHLRADVSTAQGRKAYFDRLASYLDRAAASPDRGGLPSMVQLSQLGNPDTLSNGELDVLTRMFRFDLVPWSWTRGYYFETLIRYLHNGLMAKDRGQDIFPLVPHFWRIARDSGSIDVLRALIGLSEESMNDGKVELAAVYSSLGLYVVGSLLADADRNSLNIVRSRALGKFGAAIPVKPSDPRYPVFAAQADYLTGNMQRAWQRYLAAAGKVMGLYKELDPSFCAWIIHRETEAGGFDRAADLARALIQWMDANVGNFSPETRLDILLAYANIAFSRPEYPRAKALYGQIAAAKEFEGTRGQVDAEIRIAEVDRTTGQTDESIGRLEKLLRRQDRYVQTEGNYHLALVYFGEKDHDSAKDSLEKVFGLSPNHALARILEGKINLDIKRLEEATDLQKIGDSADKRIIVPGKPLRVSVEDRTLAVVQRTTDIEIRAWTDSGDEEIFSLRPFADSRTRFSGEIGTSLSPIRKSDGVLQVLGGDKVHYDYSDAFKESHKIEEAVTHTLTVVSDAEMHASSGRIVSKEEREKAEMEAMIRAKLEMAAKKLGGPTTPLSAQRAGNQVKPGNKINVRVIDLDRSVSAERDKIAVRMRTTSGDSVPAFAMAETESHSGVFEAAVPTAPAPAAAFATDSDEGSDPNFPISSGDHPAWVALPDAKRPKQFTVDLNDNKFLGPMKVLASVPGRKLKDLVLQISRNGKAYETIGGWPTAHQAWDGSPRAVIVKVPSQQGAGTGGRRGGSTTLLQVADPGGVIEDASLSRKKIMRLKNLSAKWGADVLGQAAALGIGAGDTYVVRFSGAFYVPKRQVRSFRLNPSGTGEGITYSFLVDGVDAMGGGGTQRLEPGEEPPPIEFKGALKKGVHRFDVYVVSSPASAPGFEVLCDSEEPPYMIPCPAEMFDPELHPEMADGLESWLATFTAVEDGGVFDVAFSEGTRGRALRLIMHDFETDAPAINKIHLQSAEGEALLPTKADLLALRRNETLEIIPGDTITIAYEDPTGIEQNKKVYESSLSVTYANGTVGAGLVVGYQMDSSGMRVPQQAQIYRFEPGDTIDVTVRDPDGDISEKEDIVEFTVQTFGKEPIKLQAQETGEHSGAFAGRIFPINESPKRKSEVRVVDGDDLVLAYMDKENTEPGVPWIRSVVVDQVWYQDPEVRIYEVQSHELGAEGATTTGARRQPQRAAALRRGDDTPEETIKAMFELVATRPEEAVQEGPIEAVVGGPVILELQWPTIARSSVSKASIYVQTSAGRKAYGQEIPEGSYDLGVPGTIKLTTGIGDSGAMQVPLGYSGVTVVGNREAAAATAVEAGRFTFSVPMAPGAVPSMSLAELSEEDLEALDEGIDPNVLKIRGNDELHLGFRYVDDQMQTNWIMRVVKLVPGGVLFDIMDKEYIENVSAMHVGKSAYFRVINPAADVSDERDRTNIKLNSTAGHERQLELTETFAHSGVFKGLVKLEYATAEAEQMQDVVPVTYGATVVAKYAPGEGLTPLERSLEVFKGSNGDVMPFSKRFKDPSIAVRTQLAIAEAYFELAKEHRRMKQKKLSQYEIGEGKRVLEEAIADYPDTEAQAQADYLLANLSLEFAEDAAEAATKEEFYREAVVRFRDIVAMHPDSEYAPRAQYKKALALEKLGDIDIACEEYVKLSYRWPEHQLIAETIARLGQYFYRKGKGINDAAEKLTDQIEQEKLRMQARDFYTTSAEVFGRLAVRFPSHKLADKTTVLSGQCYMRAENYKSAVGAFRLVTENAEADKNVRPEAMYWCGDSYYRLEDALALVEAYRMWKKLTWDYPASKWAKYARGRLAEPEMARLDRE